MSEKKLPRHLIPLLFASIRNEEARQYLKFKYRIESKKFKLNPNFYLYNYFRNKAGYSSYGVSYDQVEAHKTKTNIQGAIVIGWRETATITALRCTAMFAATGCQGLRFLTG